MENLGEIGKVMIESQVSAFIWSATWNLNFFLNLFLAFPIKNI